MGAVISGPGNVDFTVKKSQLDSLDKALKEQNRKTLSKIPKIIEENNQK